MRGGMQMGSLLSMIVSLASVLVNIALSAAIIFFSLRLGGII